MIQRLLRAALLLIVVISCMEAKATHILGGNLGYTYIGETSPGSQIYRYNIYIQFYLNCGFDSNWQSVGGLLNSNGGSLPVGIYTQDPNAPTANKTRITTVNLTLMDSAFISSNLPGGCTVGAGLCTQMGMISGTVDLPLNFGGYHAYFQMNARNGSISNLFNPGMTGIGFYAFIPPPLLQNSSPIWLGDPTPLLCINDTSTFINSATDPDGDQLIFSFETPYNSVGPGGGIIQPPNVLPNTIPLVDFLPGFSVAQPFGTGGYAFINGATGLTRYVPPLQGNYVVAVEVKEYRNGVLIGRTRRDLQLQAVVCPPNDAPIPQTVQPTSYSVQAGDLLCFDLGFQDPNADSLMLTASGTIFNGSVFNPAATIDSPVVGNGSLGSTFCWDTDCSQAQTQPYLFSVSVSDNGCPPRTLDIIYQINVLGFTGPVSVTGPAQVCAGTQGSTYSVAAITGATFAWNVTGGTLSSGQGTNSIVVNWGSAGPGVVQVSATNTQGCSSAPVSLDVTVVPLPAVNAGADATICLGESVTLGGAPTGPAGSIYTWTPSPGPGSNVANPSATPLATTDFIVQVSNSGCSARDTVRITVNDPQVDAGNDVSFCAGGSVQLNAVGTGSIQWSPALGLSATDIADPIADPDQTTVYIATLTDGAGCNAVDSVTLSVNELPVVSAGSDQTPCENTSIMVGGAPTGPSGSTFTWSPTTGLNDASLANPTLSVTTDGTYTVMVTDTNQCENSDTVEITVLPLPAVNAGPDLSVCFGENTQLQGSGSGDLLWTPAFGLSDTTVPDPICMPESTITYTLTVTGSNTCTNSDQATVTVNVLPNANAGVDQTVCAGDSVQIGTGGPGDFQWTPAAGLSATNVATPMASPASTTTYVVRITNDLSCNDVDSVTVTVVPQSGAGDDGTLEICGSGVPTDLLAQLGGTPDGGGQWFAPDLQSHGSELDPATDIAGAYAYVVGIGTPCIDSAFVQVTITVPQVQFDGDNTICAGDSTMITASGGAAYSWSPSTDLSDPAIADPWFSPGTTTAYTLTVTDGGGCTASSEITITVNDLPTVNAGNDVSICAGNSAAIGGSPTGPSGSSYSWTPSTGLDDAAASNPSAQPTNTTTYLVSVVDGNQCSAMDSVVVTVNALPTLEAGDDVPLCTGGSVQLNATGTGTFVWDPSNGLNDPNIADPIASPTVTTTYSIELTDANGCISSDALTITVNELPTIDAGTDSWLCLGSTIQLNATGSPGTFSWTPANLVADPASASTTAVPDMSTTFTVSVTDANGCTASDGLIVAVGVDPPIDAGADQSGCAGLVVQLGGSPTSVPGSSYQWSPSDGLDDTAASNPIATPTVTTEYTLTVSNDTCTSTDVVLVSITGQGVAEFDARFEAGCDGIKGFFTDNSTGAVSRLWDFGNGNTSTLSNPQAVLPYGQVSLVTLTITDAGGCTSTESRTFDTAAYNELVQISVPNIFTPNGDGKNDVFTLDTDAFLGPCTTMEIMNRWGETLFVTQANNITWDGRTLAGLAASDGVYFYVISVNELTFKGTVQLAR